MQKQGECRSEYRMLLVLCVMNLFLTIETRSQIRAIPSLSAVQEFQFPGLVNHAVVLHFSSQRYTDILFFQEDSSIVSILRNNGSGSFTELREIARSANITSMSVGNINNDGIDDIVIVHRDQNQVEVLLSRRTDSAYSSSVYPVNFYPEKAVIGDITNDRIPDIISYGKLSSGVSVLRGKGAGTFHPFKILFENIPVSEFSLIALNGDNIPDAAVHNWLTNETVLYLGLGRMKFAEQTVLSFAADTVETVFTDFTGDGIADVAVISRQNVTVQILHGDGLGNFSFSQAIPLSTSSRSIRNGTFLQSTANDIVISGNDSRTFSLLLNRSDGIFYDEIIFGIRDSDTDILSGDLDGDGYTDILLYNDRQNQYSVIWNSHTSRTIDGVVSSYAVGRMPENFYVNDINSDGKDDLVVSNRESSTLSVLLSAGTSFSGQISIETPEHPYSVSLYAKSDTSITFYTVHQDNPKVSLISMHKDDSLASLAGEIEQFSISLPERPVNVLPDVSYMQKGISLYAFMSTATNAIVFYQQVKGTRFLAKSLVPIIPATIMYSTINDLNDDGKTDLLYIYKEEKTKSSVLGITLNDTTGEFKGRVYSFVLPDSGIRKAMLFIDDVNGDQFKDCFIYSAPENVLRLALGIKDDVFGEFEDIITGISLQNSHQMQLFDYDNDGIPDIMLSDAESDKVFLYRGKGNGKYFSKKFVMDIPKGSNYRCGDFNGDALTDIVFTNPNRHSISVRYGSKK